MLRVPKCVCYADFDDCTPIRYGYLRPQNMSVKLYTSAVNVGRGACLGDVLNEWQSKIYQKW